MHSPFVFDLVTKCFHDKTIYPEYEILKNYRNSLLENKNTIEVTDFGAGSRVFKSNTREVYKITKTAGITSKNAELLFRIVRYFKPQNVLEIGTSLGLATSALSIGSSNAQITTLEGCPNTMNQAQAQFQKFKFKNVDFIYPHSGIKALNNFNLDIQAGQKVLILGKTGSGKSSIAQILNRMYHVNAGQVLLDDRPIESIDFLSLRKRIGYVQQDVFLFSDSIQNNIQFGVVSSEEAIKAAAKSAHILKEMDI